MVQPIGCEFRAEYGLKIPMGRIVNFDKLNAYPIYYYINNKYDN